MGSESSRLAPAEAPCSVHQRATERHDVFIVAVFSQKMFFLPLNICCCATEFQQRRKIQNGVSQVQLLQLTFPPPRSVGWLRSPEGTCGKKGPDRVRGGAPVHSRTGSERENPAEQAVDPVVRFPAVTVVSFFLASAVLSPKGETILHIFPYSQPSLNRNWIRATQEP